MQLPALLDALSTPRSPRRRRQRDALPGERRGALVRRVARRRRGGQVAVPAVPAPARTASRARWSGASPGASGAASCSSGRRRAAQAAAGPAPEERGRPRDRDLAARARARRPAPRPHRARPVRRSRRRVPAVRRPRPSRQECHHDRSRARTSPSNPATQPDTEVRLDALLHRQWQADHVRNQRHVADLRLAATGPGPR